MLVLVFALLLAVAAPAAPGVAAQPASSCDSGVGARTPIVLVHGYNADARSWARATRDLLSAPRQRFCTTAFDYGPVSTSWVRDADIAQALAARVLSLANASTSAGGSGKVVVVAHSMGGLAIRCAASTRCGGNDAAGRVLRAVVMFGTPNLGTFLKGYGRSHVANVLGNLLGAACRRGDPFDANPVLRGTCGQVRALGTSDAAEAFTPGSDELRELPALPSAVPVLAVAGSVKLGTSFWGRPAKRLGDVGDLIVGQDSALAAARRVGGIGGEVVRDCGVLDVTSTLTGLEAIPTLQPELRCSHVSETNNPDWLVLVTQLVRTLDADQPQPVTAAEVGSMTLPRGNACGYASPEFERGVRLAGGEAESQSGGFIQLSQALFTDVDGDGVGDGLASLICSSGAGGTSSTLVLLRASDRKVVEVRYGEAAERIFPALSVYRIYEMRLDGPVVTLLASGHGADDATCCPSDVLSIRYDLGIRGPRFRDARLGTGDPRALPRVGSTYDVGERVKRVLTRAGVELSPGCGAYLAVLGGRLGSGDLDVIESYDGGECGGDGISEFLQVRGFRVVARGDACECEVQSDNWEELNEPYRYADGDSFVIQPAGGSYRLVPARS